MYNRDTGKLKRSGRVIHSVKRISRSQFDTPAGLIDGYYIELDHRMDMEYKSQLRLSLGLGFVWMRDPSMAQGNIRSRSWESLARQKPQQPDWPRDNFKFSRPST